MFITLNKEEYESKFSRFQGKELSPPLLTQRCLITSYLKSLMVKVSGELNILHWTNPFKSIHWYFEWRLNGSWLKISNGFIFPHTWNGLKITEKKFKLQIYRILLELCFFLYFFAYQSMNVISLEEIFGLVKPKKEPNRLDKHQTFFFSKIDMFYFHA